MKYDAKEFKKLELIFAENIYTQDLKRHIDKSASSEVLNLSGWSLGVTLDSEDLTNLFKYIKLRCTNLKRMDLSNNALTFLPEDIGELKSLERLFLKDNLLESLPIQMRNLEKIEKLDLSGNRFNFLPSGGVLSGHVDLRGNLFPLYARNFDDLTKYHTEYAYRAAISKKVEENVRNFTALVTAGRTIDNSKSKHTDIMVEVGKNFNDGTIEPRCWQVLLHWGKEAMDKGRPVPGDNAVTIKDYVEYVLKSDVQMKHVDKLVSETMKNLNAGNPSLKSC